jgi:thymidylate kinase
VSLIFITGISGSGKTTVKDALIRRGYAAYDTDENGLTAWTHKQSGRPAEAKPTIQYGTPKWYATYQWTLQAGKVREKAKHARGELVFMCGVPGNWPDAMPMFDKIFCLSLDDKALRHRLLNRTNNNYGKASHELSDIMGWNKTMAADAERRGAVIIDANRPVEEIVDTILKNLG